ncbi:MAG: hypothetical protein ACTSQY_06515, partial [Candidatus Odinarchaeia archaeon]
MRRLKKLSVFFTAFMLILLFLPLTSMFFNPAIAQNNGVYDGSHAGTQSNEWAPDLYSDWDKRIMITVTEPNVCDRINEPIDVFLTFDAGEARIGKFRVLFYNG